MWLEVEQLCKVLLLSTSTSSTSTSAWHSFYCHFYCLLPSAFCFLLSAFCFLLLLLLLLLLFYSSTLLLLLLLLLLLQPLVALLPSFYLQTGSGSTVLLASTSTQSRLQGWGTVYCQYTGAFRLDQSDWTLDQLSIPEMMHRIVKYYYYT